MSCPTCSHTMECLYSRDGESAFWCPRCGTVKSPWLTSPAGERPKLVERCREFGLIGSAWGHLWRQLGIAESINLPGDRPQ